jgi:hypothetical protein
MQLVDQKIKLSNNEVWELHRVRDDLTSRERSKYLLLIESLIEEIRKAKEAFGLEVDESSLMREVEATMMGVRVTIEGLRPQSLIRYGVLSEDDEAQLNLAYMNFDNIFGREKF